MCSLDDISADLILLETQRKSLLNTLEKLKPRGGSSLGSSLTLQCQKLQELSSSIQSAIQTRFEQLQSKENEVENRLKQLEMRENDLGKRLKLNDVSIGKGSSLLGLKFIVSTDGERLLMFLNQHENEHQKLADEVYNVLKMSDNPGKLVWQAVKGVFSRKGNVGVERNVERKSCLVLLEGLIRVRPDIKKSVKKEAAFMAKQWRLKIGMEDEDDMEILLFLMVVGAFGLLGHFNSKEIRSLFERVAQHNQASLLGGIFGFFVKAAPESCFLHCQDQVKMEQLPESSNIMFEAIDDAVINYSCPSSADLKFIASADADRLLMFLNKHQNDDKIGENVYNAMRISGNPAKLVLNTVKAGVSEKANVGIARGLVKNSCAILLEQLIRLRPEVSQKLRKKALKVAQQLKGNIRTQGNYDEEVLVFLMLICAYGLSSEFNLKEIKSLFQTVSQHKQAPILGPILGFVDETLVRGGQHCQAYVEQSEADNFQLDSFLPSEAKFEQYIASSSTSYWLELQSLSISMDATGLILFLSKHVEDHNLMRDDISNALQLASDPAKLVLDALSRFFRSKSGDGFKGPALSNARKSCILLLEQLRACSVQIECNANEEALKLAVEWKKRMEEKYPQGVMAYGFLQFIITYCLKSAYDADELLRLLVTASEYRQSPDLCLALGLVDKISVLIETLIKNNLRLEAIAYISAFDLADKYPPAQLLNAHLKYSKIRKYKKAKKSDLKLNQTIDQEIAIMRRVIKCIATHKLESLYPPKDLENYILHLEQMKEQGNDITQGEKKKQERKILSVTSSNAKPQHESGIKWPCMNMSAETTAALSASAGCNLQLEPPPLEQPGSLIADQAAACSLWGSAAFSVDTNSFSWQNGCAIARDRSLEQFTPTAAVDKAAPESSIHPAQVKIDQSQSENFQLDGFVPSEARIKLQSYSTNMDARGLISFLCEHVEDHSLMRCEISDALHLAPNPAKLVLDALSTFYNSKSGDASKNKKNKSIFFNSEALCNVRTSCILLLEQLRTVTFQIEPHVNEEVLKLAVDWKERMQKYQKGVMAYGFLQLIVTYRLMSVYDVDELLCILVIASEYKQSPDLCLVLGLTDKIHALIETLVKNNLRLEALAYICAFDLVDKFPPAQMLKVHLEYSRESLLHQAKRSHWKWHQIIDHEIAVARKVIGCIADHKLESIYPPNNLEDYIIQLERQKAEGNDAARKQKQKTGTKKAPQVPSKPQHECGTKLSSINVSVEAGSSASASASSTVTLSPFQLLESFFADQAVPHLLGDSTNFPANTNQLSGKKQADFAVVADNWSSDSD
ncbi:hypothetical protein PTKIN_Ptkin06aG0160200 [Pterospermum kingtungense]